MNNKEIWNNALRQLEATFSSSINVTKKSSSSVGGKIDAEGNILVAKVAGEVHSEISSGHENQYEKNFLAGKENDLDYLATELKQKNKRLIIEDFHYLTEEERRNVAFDLKALYELGVYVIVVGIWSEQNLLTYYNGDLTGRIEEININWNTVELSNVIEKGEEILNVKFNEDLKHEIIESSFQNVGILQRLAEKICLANNVLTPLLTSFNFEKNGNFDDAVKQVISDIGQRYTRICEVFVKGFRTDTKLRIYYKIFRLLTKAAEQNLIIGLPSSFLLKNIQSLGDEEIRQADLTQCLDRIERLQSSRQITPLLVSYNKNLRLLALMDREFLFYRKYSGVNWDELVPD